MKKVLAIVLILVLLVGTLGLTACGGGKAENEVWIGATNAGYGIEWLKKSAEEFNAMQSEYVVVLNDCESPNFDSKGEQQLKMPETAENDLYIISEVWWKTNAKNCFFEPLDEVYNAPFNSEMSIMEAMREENIAEALVEDKNGEEHYYAINYASTAAGLIYNKTIGDYYESLPAWGNTVKMSTIKNGGTVDQLVTWMEKIEELSKTYYAFGSNGKYLDGATTINTNNGTVPAVYPMVYAGKHSYWDAVVNTWWAQAAGITGYRSFFEYASPTIYADQARLRALKALEKLDVNDNSVPGSVNMDHIVSQDEFLKGRAALIPCGDWMYYESKQNATNWNVDFEMIYVPACDNQVPQSNRKIIQYSDGGLAVIPSGDKNPNTNVEGAKAFLKYLFSEQGCLNYTMETGAMWGFDGTTDPNTTYATAVANGDVGQGMSTYNYGVYNLLLNANGHITKLPNNPDAPNAAFATTSGVGGEWPSLDMSKIRDGSMTAQEAFNKCINYVGAETAEHNSNSEWDRWWNIVHTVA